MMSEFQFTCLTDPRLAAHALSPTPAWLWSTDATRVLWSNPIGAAIFDAASPAELAAIRYEPGHTAAAQVARLAGTLPQGATARLERLRGFGAPFASTLICLCSRIVLADNSSAVLVVATERAGKDLSLPDRARRLMADFKRPAAIFTADGELIEATPEALERFHDKRDLIALGAEKLAREAMLNGVSEGNITTGTITMVRLGASATVALLLAYYTPEQIAQAAPQSVAAPVAADPVRAQPHARSVPFHLADGCGQPLHARRGRIRQADRAAGCRRARSPVGRDRRRAQARPARPGGACAGRARDLERHRRAVAGRGCPWTACRRNVGPSGVRPRPPVCRLSRIRHLPRCRPACAR